MAYKHGIYPSELPTSLTAPAEATCGLQVIFGTAPVNLLDDPESAVNTPLLVNTYEGAAASVGYSSDFKAYTICQSIDASFRVVGVSPMVLINVLDPAKHVADIADVQIQVNNGTAVLEQAGVLLKSLEVKSGSTVLAAEEDYVAAFDDDGFVTIAIVSGSKADGATTLSVAGKKLDPAKVTPADIIGGINAKGVETGIQVLRQIYPKLSMTPGLLLAPGWSENATVAAALQAACEKINGVFSCNCFVDVDCSETGATQYMDVKQQKEKQAITSRHCYAVWLYGKVGDVIYAGSALAAALTQYTDSQNQGIPYVSPSNKTIALSAACLADGTEVLLDQEQANVVNSYGVGTWLNMDGFRLWGNNTACYPGNTDPKDRFFSVRRFFDWDNATFIRTYFQKVDSPMNHRLIEALVDSENVRGNGFVSRGICARYELLYIESENATVDLMNGTITFHKYMTPYTPAEDIEELVEFDPNALSSALSQ